MPRLATPHIEVAAYPEMHPGRARSSRPAGLATKVRAGANSTSPSIFSTPTPYSRFVEEAQRLGVHIPIVPGLMPITGASQLLLFSTPAGRDSALIRLRLQGFGDDTASIRAFGLDVVSQLASSCCALAPRLALLHHEPKRAHAGLCQRLGLVKIGASFDFAPCAAMNAMRIPALLIASWLPPCPPRPPGPSPMAMGAATSPPEEPPYVQYMSPRCRIAAPQPAGAHGVFLPGDRRYAARVPARLRRTGIGRTPALLRRRQDARRHKYDDWRDERKQTADQYKSERAEVLAQRREQGRSASAFSPAIGAMR